MYINIQEVISSIQLPYKSEMYVNTTLHLGNLILFCLLILLDLYIYF